ncbi:hypothetical protein GS518_06615 [Leptospira interrogans]|uniref:Lipoprotein n=1 Tax=Leptospira interrogans serovar Icterohaemorrhagiae TaxID=90062 RepID=A0AAW4JW62_LEPIR|nr:hypothetical protein [Leptospira interrogans]APH41231.1 Uncharacterized protein A9P81_1407 [Leptospira interrogans serovar Copenhageni/Icterohaemorrhagiae]OCC28841.1 Uncharacterized protein GNX_2660 [Leptospira interrogans serovar Canicola]ARB97268.1 hypothetical protein A6J42_19060 [Leptospira interrogans serovar Copenhageni]EKP20770.1 hypothetical protein LEP1GSC117_2647 [Leptospira interrogans serovar Icterohaemorrhagiae str. Verdun LP]EKP77730.1 hypothetical protein LEP1GSC173_2309 [Lep
MKVKLDFKKWMTLWVIFIFCGTVFAKETEKKEPDKNSSSKLGIQGCCRIKMTGGGYDYFISTEEECASHKQFHSFLKERTLCFESFPE